MEKNIFKEQDYYIWLCNRIDLIGIELEYSKSVKHRQLSRALANMLASYQKEKKKLEKIYGIQNKDNNNW